MICDGVLDPAVSGNFDGHPTADLAKRIFLACTKAGIDTPPEIMRYFCNEIEKQVKSYALDNPKSDKDNLSVKLGVASDIANAKNDGRTHEEVFKLWADELNIPHGGEDGHIPPWKVLQERHKQWKRRKSIHLLPAENGRIYVSVS